MTLSDGERKLVVMLLDMLSDRLSNDGCNDLTDEQLACLSKKEWVELSRFYHEKNGDPEAHDSRFPHHMGNHCVATALGWRLEE